MNEIDWSKAPEGATHYFPSTEEWYLAGNGCAPLVWTGMWCKAFQFSQREHKCVQRPTTQSWSDEGLPPVGVVCEAGIPHTSGANGENRSIVWIEGRVIAYHEIKGRQYAWFAEDDGFYPPAVLEFRPIRTPEQIAADEREAACEAMLQIAKARRPDPDVYEAIATLYDAGYRKP